MVKSYKLKSEMNEGDTVVGVVYAVGAEQVIRDGFDVLEEFNNVPYQPTVIGYMVKVDDAKMNDCECAEFGWCVACDTDATKCTVCESTEVHLHPEVDDAWYQLWRSRWPKCPTVHGEMDDSKFTRKCTYDGDSYCYHPPEISHWSEVDLDRRIVLCNKQHLNDTELKEFAEINRRLGYVSKVDNEVMDEVDDDDFASRLADEYLNDAEYKVVSRGRYLGPDVTE